MRPNQPLHRSLAHLALLLSISIILTRFFSQEVVIAGVLGLRLSFGGVPIVLAGILFGPMAGALVGGLADLVGFMLVPRGTFFPGFTLTAALAGLLPPLLLGRRRWQGFGFWHLLIVLYATNILTSILLNTLWVHMLYGTAIVVLLPPRVVATLIMVPIHSLMIIFFFRHKALAPLMRKIQQR